MIHKDVKIAIKEAKKNHDDVKVECLNDLLDKAVEVANSRRYNVNMHSIPDDIVVDAIRKELGRLKNEYSSHKGGDDSKNNKAKVAILKSFMPRQLSRREVEEEVSWILASGAFDTYGKRMKVVMSEIGGCTNTRIIREVVGAYSD